MAGGQGTVAPLGVKAAGSEPLWRRFCLPAPGEKISKASRWEGELSCHTTGPGKQCLS